MKGCETMNKPTVELVKDLSTREGVKEIVVEPYQNRTITVDGPCIILVIED